MTQKSKLTAVLAAVLIIVCAGALLYALGFRIAGNFRIGKLGTIRVATSLSNTSVFLDASEKKTSVKDGEVLSFSATPESHSIIVSRDGYFPWAKTVDLSSGGKAELSPILVPQNPSGVIITPKDSAYREILAKIAGNTLPTKEAPLFSADKSVAVWVENNAVIAKIGGALHTVIQPETTIKNVSFYKNRSDAIIFSTQDGVYMIEIDTSLTPNFMPIYRGKNPAFVPSGQNTLFVKDETALMEVNL